MTCIFGPHLTEYGQTIKTLKRGKSGNQKYREIWKHGIIASWHHLGVSTFILSPWLGLQNSGSTQASASWTPVMSSAFARLTAMFDPAPPRPPRLVAEALRTRGIRSELSTIPMARFRTVRKDGAELSSDNHSSRGVHSFLAQLVLGVDLIPRLERVTVVRVDLDVMVYLLHSLFSVWVKL